MIYRLIFNRSPEEKKKAILTTKGVNIGCFIKDNRKAYVYLLDNFFVEVLYANDDVNDAIEEAKTFTDYRKLEKYLEESVRETLKSSKG